MGRAYRVSVRGTGMNCSGPIIGVELFVTGPLLINGDEAHLVDVGGFPKIGGKPPKMDGENNGKKTPYFLMDDLGGFNPLFLETSRCNLQTKKTTCRISSLESLSDLGLGRFEIQNGPFLPKGF